MKRIDGRECDQLREYSFVRDYLIHPLASVLVKCGNTHVICAASAENKVPPWMKAQKVAGGWISGEYAMLPGATGERGRRESAGGKPNGRSLEIQRLIGRSLRSMADLEQLGENTLYLDCDVINADGGTRCASVSGASLALEMALRSPQGGKMFGTNALRCSVAAVSVGIVDGVPMLDLCYEEDCRAEVDMNVVMTSGGELVEVQGTAEGKPFSRSMMNELMDLAEHGLKQIFELQRTAMEEAMQKWRKTEG